MEKDRSISLTQIHTIECCRGDSEVKSACCSCEGHCFRSQHPQGSSQLPVSPVPGDAMPSSGIHGHMHASGSHKVTICFHLTVLYAWHTEALWGQEKVWSWNENVSEARSHDRDKTKRTGMLTVLTRVTSNSVDHKGFIQYSTTTIQASRPDNTGYWTQMSQHMC